MRLLTEYMAVPEVNGAVVDKSLVENKYVPTNAAADSAGNRNLQLARQQEEHKTNLIAVLSNFPVTALWLLSKYEQTNTKDEQDDVVNVPSDINDFLADIKNHYQAISANKQNEDVHAAAKQRLMAAVQHFPFAYEDLIKLVDIVAYTFKRRGLTVEPDICSRYYHKQNQAKKQSDIILKRLDGAAKQGNSSLAECYKTVDSSQYDGQFLFLSNKEMRELLPDVILAEHYWLEYRQQLALANSKLVLFIANQYKGNFLDFEDLVQEGHTGLLKAVDRFKHHLDFQFSTYAGYWIRQAISRALSRSERVVRIPCGQIATINRLFRSKEELTNKYGKEPSMEELAEYAKLSREEVVNILSISQTAVALESFDDDEEAQTFAPIDFLEQKVFNHSYSMIADEQLKSVVDTAVKGLNQREAKILCSHFGVGTDEQMTLQEIGAQMNLTRERVRQIQVVALSKIKMRYGEQLLSFCD